MAHLHPSINESAQCLLRGGTLIFPTETFYALGCLATNAGAVARIYQIKERDSRLPLPLLAADREQAAQVVCLDTAPQQLFNAFWPGPLTVLLPALPTLSPLLINNRGKAAIRVSPHKQARELARLAGGVLTASSANLHGRPPARRLQDIDGELIRSFDRQNAEAGIFKGSIRPAGGLPSTLVEPLDTVKHGKLHLRLLRTGAVSVQALEAAGFYIVSQ